MLENCALHSMEVADTPDTIHTGKCKVGGFHVETDKTNDVTVVLKDGTIELITHITTGTKDSEIVAFPGWVQCTTSLIVTLAGTASRVTVFWKQM